MTKSQRRLLNGRFSKYSESTDVFPVPGSREILIRPFLSKKAWVIGPRGKITTIFYASKVSPKVSLIID